MRSGEKPTKKLWFNFNPDVDASNGAQTSCQTWVNGTLVDYDITFFQNPANLSCSISHATDVWLVRFVHRCRYSDDIHITLLQVINIAGQF